MTYLPTYSIQTQYFLYSLILGLIVGIIYDLLRAIREAFEYQRKPRFYLTDILIFVVAAFGFEIYTLAFGYGEIRWYALFGMFLGFTIYLNTLGAISFYIEKTSAFIMNMPLIFFTKTLKNLYLQVYNSCVVFVNRLKNNRFKMQRTGEQGEEGEKEQ